ncbi:MAG: DUF3570 domain-containing protein [Rhodoferax sp.]|nr:DUF3570 domain-containing protein [Rhodoferax sp.]
MNRNTPPAAHASRRASGVMLASLMLPGLAALAGLGPLAVKAVKAETAPERTTIGIQYGSYQDGQPDWERVEVKAPSLYIQAPIASDWALTASAVADSVSGATPRWHTQHAVISGASRMHDDRVAVDVKVTRYLARSAWSVSVAHSGEHDYQSRAYGLDARWSTDDNNRTWALGYGVTLDRIDNSYSGGSVLDKQRRTQELMLGLTQVLTPADIAQFNLTRSDGSGYYSDPYKTLDQRPEQRNTWIALARWNHYVEPQDAALRSSYRYYSDTFGIQSHTIGLEWEQPLGRWTVTPAVRYYSQSAASFYLDPILNAQGQYDQAAVRQRAFANDDKQTNQSTDQRLSAFGALTWSIKTAYAFTQYTVADIKLETYRQTAALHLGSAGSPNLDPFHATFWQIGLTHRF